MGSAVGHVLLPSVGAGAVMAHMLDSHEGTPGPTADVAGWFLSAGDHGPRLPSPAVRLSPPRRNCIRKLHVGYSKD